MVSYWLALLWGFVILASLVGWGATLNRPLFSTQRVDWGVTGRSSSFGFDKAAHYGSLLAIIAIGAAIRAHYLSLPIKYDEAATFLNYARQPLWGAISDYSYPNNHLLHTLCAHLSRKFLAITIGHYGSQHSSAAVHWCRQPMVWHECFPTEMLRSSLRR
jgi:hypothetical protein